MVFFGVCLSLALALGCSGKKEKEGESSSLKEDDRVTKVELQADATFGLLVVVATEGVVAGTRKAEVVRCTRLKDGPLEVLVKLWDGKEYNASAQAPGDFFAAGKNVTVRVTLLKPRAKVGDKHQFVVVDNKMLALVHTSTVSIEQN